MNFWNDTKFVTQIERKLCTQKVCHNDVKIIHGIGHIYLKQVQLLFQTTFKII
jgi:hypothetical protein